MCLKKLFSLLTKKSEKNDKQSKVVYSKNVKLDSRKINKSVNPKKNDWANSSGLYRKLSDPQKQKLDKIIDILEREDRNL
jgi:hypothetical protein